MGTRGFRKDWKHPSTDVIEWLGGFDQVYHTLIHESEFDWNTFDETVRTQMIEQSHILIETDGKWFRLVEVGAFTGNIHNPPTVAQTEQNNGTLWVKAK